MPPLVEFEVFRDYLGVAAADPAEDDVSRLLDAICAEARRLSRRDFEGDEGGSYDQVIRIRGVREFALPHVPVRAITSIAPAYFDGTTGDVYATTDYRVEDADRGLIRLRFGPEYVRAIWTTTGAMPATFTRVYQSSRSSKSQIGRVWPTISAMALAVSSALPPPKAMTPSCPPRR